MKLYKLVGDFSITYIDLKQIESVVAYQTSKGYNKEPSDVTAYYLNILLKSGNYTKVYFARESNRDQALNELLENYDKLNK